MDARKFLVECHRCCEECKKKYRDSRPMTQEENCSRCIFEEPLCEFAEPYAETIVNIVEEFSLNHPVETRQSKFLRMYPNAPIGEDGLVALCLCDFDTTYDQCDAKDCASCRKKYWLAPFEEEDKSDGCG